LRRSAEFLGVLTRDLVFQRVVLREQLAKLLRLFRFKPCLRFVPAARTLMRLWARGRIFPEYMRVARVGATICPAQRPVLRKRAPCTASMRRLYGGSFPISVLIAPAGIFCSAYAASLMRWS